MSACNYALSDLTWTGIRATSFPTNEMHFQTQSKTCPDVSSLPSNPRRHQIWTEWDRSHLSCKFYAGWVVWCVGSAECDESLVLNFKSKIAASFRHRRLMLCHASALMGNWFEGSWVRHRCDWLTCALVITVSQRESSSNGDAFDRESDHVRSWIILFTYITSTQHAD